MFKVFIKVNQGLILSQISPNSGHNEEITVHGN